MLVLHNMRSYLLAGAVLFCANGLALLLYPLRWPYATPRTFLALDHIPVFFSLAFLLVGIIKLLAAFFLRRRWQIAAVLSALFLSSTWVCVTLAAMVQALQSGPNFVPFLWVYFFTITPVLWGYFAIVTQAVLPYAALDREDMDSFLRSRNLLLQRVREVADTLQEPPVETDTLHGV